MKVSVLIPIVALHCASVGSLNFHEQRARLLDQFTQLSTTGKGFGCKKAVLESIRVAARSTRSRGSTMHAATLLAADGWRSAGLARARSWRRSAGSKALGLYCVDDRILFLQRAPREAVPGV